MRRLALIPAMLALLWLMGCETDQGDAGEVATEVQQEAALEVEPDASPDAVTEPGPETVPDAVTDAVPEPGLETVPDAVTDAVPDTEPEPEPEILPDSSETTLPPACCSDDDDCDAGSVCARVNGWEPEGPGVCRPVLEPGRCYSDWDCNWGEECHGAALCPCNVDCDMDYEGPGVCVYPALTCTPIKEEWVQEWCDAASLVIWDGEKCKATGPGKCECRPFCDLTFQSMEECEFHCVGEDECKVPEPIQAYVFLAGDAMGGPDSWEPVEVQGDAEVTVKKPNTEGYYAGATNFTFHFGATGTDLLVTAWLPLGLDLPVEVGDVVHVFVKQDQPWWTDSALVVWSAAGELLAFATDASSTSTWFDCGGKLPCPFFSQQPTTCPVQPQNCGAGVEPPVSLGLDQGLDGLPVATTLRQGEWQETNGGLVHLVARSYHVTDMQCMDYPETWVDALILRPAKPLKLQFPKENPSFFEFYELCHLKDGVDPTPELQAIDPSLYCGVAGGFVGCDPETEVGCHGDLEYFEDSKVISDAKWQQLLDLAALPWVTKIGGGHFVE
jgi:hypothetical protein